MGFVDIREVVHGRRDDDRLSGDQVRDVIRMQEVVLHSTLEHALSLFVGEVWERCSADLRKHLIPHAKQHDYSVWPQSRYGRISALLRFEHRCVKEACDFNGDRTHQIV